MVADTTRAIRVLETSHPPNYYLPRSDVAPGVLATTPASSLCEWKGLARYFDVHAGDRVEAAAAWSYEDPMPGFEAIAGHVAFYASRMDACYVGDAGPTAARRLLRRVDHRLGRRPLQGRGGQRGLVIPRRCGAGIRIGVRLRITTISVMRTRTPPPHLRFT